MHINPVGIETRFMKEIFDCSKEDLNYLRRLIVRFENEYNHDVVSELVAMIIENKSIELDCYTIDSLIYFTIVKYAGRYLEEKCHLKNVENTESFGLLCEELGEIDFKNIDSELVIDTEEHRKYYNINLDFWDGFVETLRLFTKQNK